MSVRCIPVKGVKFLCSMYIFYLLGSSRLSNCLLRFKVFPPFFLILLVSSKNPKKDVFSGEKLSFYEHALRDVVIIFLIPWSREGLFSEIFFLKDSERGKKSAGSLFLFIFIDFNLGLKALCYSRASYRSRNRVTLDSKSERFRLVFRNWT